MRAVLVVLTVLALAHGAAARWVFNSTTVGNFSLALPDFAANGSLIAVETQWAIAKNRTLATATALESVREMFYKLRAYADPARPPPPALYNRTCLPLLANLSTDPPALILSHFYACAAAKVTFEGWAFTLGCLEHVLALWQDTSSYTTAWALRGAASAALVGDDLASLANPANDTERAAMYMRISAQAHAMAEHLVSRVHLLSVLEYQDVAFPHECFPDLFVPGTGLGPFRGLAQPPNVAGGWNDTQLWRAFTDNVALGFVEPSIPALVAPQLNTSGLPVLRDLPPAGVFGIEARWVNGMWQSLEGVPAGAGAESYDISSLVGLGTPVNAHIYAYTTMHNRGPYHVRLTSVLGLANATTFAAELCVLPHLNTHNLTVCAHAVNASVVYTLDGFMPQNVATAFELPRQPEAPFSAIVRWAAPSNTTQPTVRVWRWQTVWTLVT